MIKSLFLSVGLDAGIEKAVEQGYSQPVNLEVTDQGITLRVKEVMADPFRVSLMYGIEKDGKPINPDLLFTDFMSMKPDTDPYINNYVVTDLDGNDLKGVNLPLARTHGDNAILEVGIDDPTQGYFIRSPKDIPDTIVVHFDINLLGETKGKWQLKVPVSLAPAKSATNFIPLNKRYESPFGFKLDFLQLRHGPSKSELLVDIRESQAWSNQYGTLGPQFLYRIKDEQGQVVAAWDGINDMTYSLESKNALLKQSSGGASPLWQYQGRVERTGIHSRIGSAAGSAKTRWFLEAEGRAAIVSVDATTNEVLTVSLNYDISDLPDNYAEALKTAQAEYKQQMGTHKEVFASVSYYYNRGNGQELMTFSMKQEEGEVFIQPNLVSVDLKTGKVAGYFLFPGLAKADAKMKQLAEQTVKNMPQANELPFQDVFHYKDGPINIWEFRNMAVDGSARQGGKKAQKAVQSVTIGAESNKVLEVVISPKNNNGKDKAVSKADALKIVTPVAKQVFGIDLKSYELKIDPDWGDCIFASKGKPSLVAKFDNKGNLSRIHLAVDSNNRK